MGASFIKLSRSQRQIPHKESLNHVGLMERKLRAQVLSVRSEVRVLAVHLIDPFGVAVFSRYF